MRWVRALVVAALTLSASVAAAQTRVHVWHAYRGAEEDGLRRAADAFMQEHPDVRVVLVAQPFGAYASKLESAIPTGNGPDLFIDTHDRVASYVTAHLVEPVTPSDPEAFESRIDAAHRDAFRVDGTLYGFPLSLKGAALYVNDALVAGDVEAL